jgi:hypothetical protein
MKAKARKTTYCRLPVGESRKWIGGDQIPNHLDSPLFEIRVTHRTFSNKNSPTFAERRSSSQRELTLLLTLVM